MEKKNYNVYLQQTEQYDDDVYNDCRRAICKIMIRNGNRIKISDILDELNIKRGNFYNFMNGQRKVGYDNLEKLIYKLKELDEIEQERKRKLFG